MEDSQWKMWTPDTAQQVPTSAAIYALIADDGEILYVGCAGNLRRRLAWRNGYFDHHVFYWTVRVSPKGRVEVEHPFVVRAEAHAVLKSRKHGRCVIPARLCFRECSTWRNATLCTPKQVETGLLWNHYCDVGAYPRLNGLCPAVKSAVWAGEKRADFWVTLHKSPIVKAVWESLKSEANEP